MSKHSDMMRSATTTISSEIGANFEKKDIRKAMKTLVHITFLFVASLCLIEAGETTEKPPVTDQDDGALFHSPPSGTCRYSCMKRASYLKTRSSWCWFRRCTKYSTGYRMQISMCSRCCKGWIGTPGKCKDNNECLKNPCPSLATCSNTPGSYKCICRSGYKMVGRKCVDSNECLNNPCHSSAVCHNVPGSYECGCKRGYRMTNGKCVDIDECLMRPCIPFGTCQNTQGSYKCICKTGYERIRGRCIDINECKTNLCAPTGRCLNTQGSYICICDRGYHRENNKCVDIDECQNKGICNQTCTNTPGSYVCSCADGYQIFMNRYCVDIDECRCQNGGCPFPLMCINTPGSNYCDCPYGFTSRNDKCYLIPGVKLNYTIPGNKTVIPKVKLPVLKPSGSS
ncbi:wall 2-like isoform X3 [Octopus vulgaris]|uniref:Wall 2-like isoform X3 n=1 Tax=Octopus vulgaris TaxID=6645 RepID=A0AA36BZI0_OCTVU|nr:wall 2-like isoform X3 [Octopus vulgaris]